MPASVPLRRDFDLNVRRAMMSVERRYDWRFARRLKRCACYSDPKG